MTTTPTPDQFTELADLAIIASAAIEAFYDRGTDLGELRDERERSMLLMASKGLIARAKTLQKRQAELEALTKKAG